ncbi:MAG: cell division protein ZapA [Bryobacterales bacterium]|nr:cell division protein ZapA [Bryobacterales bacterium]
MSASSTTEVSIFGQTYYIQAGGDEDQARQAANLVDKKMNLIASQVLTSDRFRVAVLAALHLADEFLTVQNRLVGLEQGVAAKSDRLTVLLDELDKADEAASG